MKKTLTLFMLKLIATICLVCVTIAWLPCSLAESKAAASNNPSDKPSKVLSKKTSRGQGQQMPPAIVEVIQVQYSTIYDQITATGSIIAIPGIVVKPEIAGRVTNIYFKSGDKVNKDTALIEIYPDIIKAQLTQNQAELRLTQLNFDRYSKLYATRTVSKAEYDKAKADLESAKAKVEQSQASLNQTVIRAPFDGRLGVSQISLGQYINAGQNIVSLQALDPIYVDFAIPEIYAGKIAVNQSVNIQSGAYPNDKFSGKVIAIDPLVNQSTRSINMRAEVSNKEEKLLPGTFADVILFTSGGKKVIKVPQTAIVYDQTGNYVYRVIDNKAVKTPVTLGQRDEQNVIVLSGLNANDTIVTAGQLKIAKDDAPVIVANSGATKK